MMKKILRTLALILVLAMTMSAVVFAAEGDVDADGKKATLTFLEGFDGSSASFEDDGDSVKVTVKNDAFKATDGYYLVLALKNKDTIDEDSILYIDQVSAADGEVSFKVYPSTMATSTIVITGVKADGTSNGKVYVAVINGKYVIGDSNGDGKFDVMDVTRLLRYLAEFKEDADIVEAASDVDGSPGVTVLDVVKMLRVLAEFEVF